ncbi:unnamed protein product [Victoria cruziana]
MIPAPCLLKSCYSLKTLECLLPRRNASPVFQSAVTELEIFQRRHQVNYPKQVSGPAWEVHVLLEEWDVLSAVASDSRWF